MASIRNWEGKCRVVIVVIDYSNSMKHFTDSIYNGCVSLKNKTQSADILFHFIGFSNSIRESPDISALKDMGGSTCIAPAFQTVHRLLQIHGCPKQVDLLFISDGQDDNMRVCVETLSGMKRMPCRSRLFCVGVLSGFPTSLVTEDLYPKFGMDSDESAPPVIPLESIEEVDWVFEQLAGLLSTDRAPPPPTFEDFTEASTPQELCQGAKRAYNACMHGCLFGKRVAELQALKECSRILGRIYGLGVLLVRAAKLSGRSVDRRLQVLPSMLFARERQERDDAAVSPNVAVKTAMELKAKVVECINHVERNAFLAQLDNDTKRRIAGFAGRYGVYTVKAFKYHGADAERTRAGFLETLRNYNAGRKEDQELEDEISGFTQEELLLDAQKVLPEFEASAHNIIDILHKVPLIGRTLTIQPPCDGAAMNPWLIEVVGMPTFVKFMTTYDLLHTPPDVLNMRANRTARAAVAPSPPVVEVLINALSYNEDNRPGSPSNLILRLYVDAINMHGASAVERQINGDTGAVQQPHVGRALLSRETHPEIYAILDNHQPGDEEHEDARAIVLLNELTENEERQNRERAAREPSWGGVEDYSGYLTEYEDVEDGAMQRRSTLRNPPPETINHLLIMPGSVGKSLRAGWMHQAATYLALRNETLYYPDAWMATMAATVTHLLGQPSAGWIQTELDVVLRSFKAVYHNENASRFYAYLSLLSSPEDHRQTLVTSGDWLPAGISCPHLTKPVFGTYLLVADMRVKFTKEALIDRHCSFLVEFFSRAKVGLVWKQKSPLVKVFDWLDDNMPLPADPLLCSPYMATALSAYGKALDEALRGIKAEDVLPPPELDMAAVMSARHFQFGVESIGVTFASIARLCGIEDYDPAFPANSPGMLARLLKVASIGDNLTRSATHVGLGMPDAEFFKIGTAEALKEYRADLAKTGRLRFQHKYEHCMFSAHQEVARSIPQAHVDAFKARWGVDLGAKLCIRKCGLSAVACTNPRCPYFLQRLDAADPPTKDGVGAKLRLHIASASIVPGLHRAVQVLLDEGRADDEDARVGMAEMVMCGRGLETKSALSLTRDERMRDRQIAFWGADETTRPLYADARVAEIRKKHNLAVGAASASYYVRLRNHIQRAFVMRGLDSLNNVSTWLKHVIRDVAGEKGKWDYADFESAVLSSSLARCPLTGRFSVVLARP